MSSNGKISSIAPANAIPGGEIEILLEDFRLEHGVDLTVLANGQQCQLVSASSRRIVAILPACEDSSAVIQVVTKGDDITSTVTLGKLLTDDAHIVANPAIDPGDGALIVTRSGSRGQQIENSILRLETDGYIDELPVEFLNPTGIAFGPTGGLYITNRAEGVLARVDRGEEAVPVATDLGIATGLAIGPDGAFYIGDRSGTIFRVREEHASPETFATLEGSVAAFHLAFGPDGRLYVSSPGFASSDLIYAIDADGSVETFVRGFGRPQGLAFDRDGNLYVAACRGGRRGIFRVSPDASQIDHFLAGGNIVGLCFTGIGEMVVAASDSIYTVNVGVYGTLLK